MAGRRSRGSRTSRRPDRPLRRSQRLAQPTLEASSEQNISPSQSPPEITPVSTTFTAPTSLGVLAAPPKFSLAFLLNEFDTENNGDTTARETHSGDSGGEAFSYDEDYEFDFGDDAMTDQVVHVDERTADELREVNNGGMQPRRRTGQTTRWIGGYKYARANKYRTKVTYRCSHYRLPCKGACEFVFRLQSYVNFVPHTCGRSASADTAHTPSIERDVTEEMKREVDRMAISMTISRSAIWDLVRAQFYGSTDASVAVVGLSREYVIRRVNRVRAEEFGGSIYGQIEVSPWSQVLSDSGLATDTNFLLFHYSYFDKSSKTRERILGWGHPVLLNMLKQKKTSLFVDGTFRCVPPKFKQCIVFTTYDRPTKGYYPCAFVLATSKKYTVYFNAVRHVLDATDDAMDPEFVYCDFEAGLIRAVGDFFPDAATIGCLFHFKQACRRRMKKYRIQDRECKIAMRSGVLDMLTVIPEEKVEKQGVQWVTNQIKAKCESAEITYSASKWASFWGYFHRTWIVKFPPKLWNVEPFTRDAVSRTNNPLKRFNREMNAVFPGTHTNLPDFVAGIEKLTRRYANLKSDIEFGRARHPARPPIRLPRPVALPDIAPTPSERSIAAAEEADSSDGGEINCLRDDRRRLVLPQRNLSRPIQMSTLQRFQEAEPFGDVIEDAIGSSGSSVEGGSA